MVPVESERQVGSPMEQAVRDEYVRRSSRERKPTRVLRIPHWANRIMNVQLRWEELTFVSTAGSMLL